MTDLAPAALARLTMPQILKRRADCHPDALAFREKVLGIWRRTSWRDYYLTTRRFAVGLWALGFRPGDRLAIASENTPQWILADLAAQMIGGACIGIYPTNPWPELQYIVRHSRSKFVVCGDQEQTDKVIDALRHEGGLPDLVKIVCVDMKGMRHYDMAELMSFADVLALGERHEAEFGPLVDRRLDAGRPSDTAAIVYTSGTTGMPKGAMLSHRNLLMAAAGVVERGKLSADNYSIICYLPLCHVAERSCTTVLQFIIGCVVNFAESIDTVAENLREVAPLGFLGVPRIWEKMQLSIMFRVKEATAFQRRVFEFCLQRGRGIGERRLANGGNFASRADRIAFFVLWLLCFRSLQKFLGLNRLRWGMCGGAPISPEVLLFFTILGLPIYQVYGMTESGGIANMQMPGFLTLGCSGPPIPGVEERVGEDGELLIRGDNVFQGYLFDEASTARTIQDGWLHTGDICTFEPNGELRVYDRKKDILITSGGKNITPSLIENALRDSIYIREAILLGDGRHFLSALIQIDYESVGKWAQQDGLAYTTYRSLAERPEVYDLIQAEVDRVNARFARVENVRKFIVLSKELDHDDGELTATMKVRRGIIEKKFQTEIATIYGGSA